MQCRKNLNAAALSLNPPKLALAGLSADIKVIVPLNLQNHVLLPNLKRSHIVIQTNKLSISLINGSKILSIPCFAITKYFAKIRSCIPWVVERSFGDKLPSIKENAPVNKRLQNYHYLRCMHSTVTKPKLKKPLKCPCYNNDAF